MEPRERLVRLADHIDHHHPKMGARILRARYGGLRATEPSPPLAAAVVAGGVGAGLVTRQLLGRLSEGRVRVLSPVFLGPVVAWAALWRWDSVRWRRRHVVLVLDLPAARLEQVVEDLAEHGLTVEPWEGRRGAGGPATGISCRLRDLRRINAHLDQFASGALAAEV